MTERYSCARTALAGGDERRATASHVRRWILLEQPGPWGADAVLSSRLPLDVAVALRGRARQLRARLLLVRRYGRSAPDRRSVLVAVTHAHGGRVERLSVQGPKDLLELDLSPLGEDRRVGGVLVAEPTYLVCTNGSHDPCCAEYGRPLARSLSQALGDGVWEASHYGGDRFAGNLVCLPHGLYFGHVDAAAGLAITSAYAQGRIVLEHFRGRSGLPFVAQAAEHFVREATGATGVDEVAFRGLQRLSRDRVRVAFADPAGGQVLAEVVVSHDRPRRLTCRAAPLSAPPRYHLAGLQGV